MILPSPPPRPRPWSQPFHLVIVLGSGGHTREMQSILANLDLRTCKRRSYIISSGDSFSIEKARECEALLQARCRQAMADSKDAVASQKLDLSGNKTTLPGESDPLMGLWEVKVVSRARKVFQSLYTTPFSSLRCLLGCIMVLRGARRNPTSSPSEYPDVIITNGPATGLIMVFASILLKFVGLSPTWKMKVIFIESWARPYSLSLTGKILLKSRACDRFFVQWEEQAKTINGGPSRGQVEFQDFTLGTVDGAKR